MEFNELTEEQKAKAKACKTPEELLAFAKDEGYELSEAELESISGGWRECRHYDFQDGMCYTDGCDSMECTQWKYN